MNMRAAMVGILTVAALAFATDIALALPANGLKTFCLGHDGIWFPPNANGVYGCLYNNGNGGGFFCGGAIRGCTNL